MENNVFYRVSVYTGEHEGNDFQAVSKYDKIFLAQKEAKEYYDSLLSSLEAYFNEELHLVLCSIEIDPSDTCEDMEDIKAIIREENCYHEEIESDIITHDYESIEGALLVEWSWDRFVGYARKYQGVRLGWHGETSEITIEEDHVFRGQISLIMTAEEIKEFGDDAVYIAHDRILDMGKWQNSSRILKDLEDLL